MKVKRMMNGLAKSAAADEREKYKQEKKEYKQMVRRLRKSKGMKASAKYEPAHEKTRDLFQGCSVKTGQTIDKGRQAKKAKMMELNITGKRYRALKKRGDL